MRHVLVALLCAAASVPAAAQAPDPSKLERIVLDELAASKTPGAAVAIVKDGAVVFAKGFGVASVETGAPVSTDMLFRLGSTTKVFNGVALATLAERGRLSLDAPISTYVKGLDPSVGRVTAAQLLSHTAGIRDFAAPAVSNDEAAFAPAIKGYGRDVFFTEPGAIHSYSSPGYWLAGVVLEEVAGRPYADAIAETVFAPLGMPRSTFRPLVAMTYPLAAGHAVEEGKGPAVVRPAANNTVMWPGGSIYSSAGEMARFAIGMVEGGVPAPVARRVMGPHAEIPGTDGAAHYGFGLISYEDRGVRILQHGGFSRGYGSMMVLAPEHRFAVVVLTNRSGSTLPKTVAAATEMYLPFKAELPPAAKPAPPAALGAYAGVFEHAPSRWEVEVRDAKLYVTTDGTRSELVHVAGHRFAVGAPGGEEIVFVPSPSGAFDHIFLGLYGARRVAAHSTGGAVRSSR
jgi:CubicO group peptidase (beta-lactamase class C family)